MGAWADACEVARRAKAGELTLAELAHPKRKGEAESAWLRHRRRIGTPRYMPPEKGERLDQLGVPFSALRYVACGRSMVDRERRYQEICAKYAEPRPQQQPSPPPRVSLPAAVREYILGELQSVVRTEVRLEMGRADQGRADHRG